MKLHIENNRPVKDLQEDFANFFPYLKIEFFSAPHKPGAESSADSIIKGNFLISQCRSIDKEGFFEINPEMSVSDLEQNFMKQFGLSVQVFRKTDHHTWLETTNTDNWSLGKQNQVGKEMMAMKQNPEKTEEIDYD